MSPLLFPFLILFALNNAIGSDEKWYTTKLVRSKLLTMLSNDECTTQWPNVTNCVEWFIDEDEKIRYVLTNSIPPFEVAPYCPFGIGKGYCLPAGATNCTQFFNLTCPAPGSPPTGDVETAQIVLYAFNLFPDPTNSSLPLNLYQLNPLTWSYDPKTHKEKIVNHLEDNSPVQLIPFIEKTLFSLDAHKRLLLSEADTVKPFGPAAPPNQGFQTTAVHIAGIQIKGPAEAEGYNVDAVKIPLICGGHVTPPVDEGPMYHFHKASTCLMENGTSNSSHSALVGIVNDGFGMYGFYDINGKQPVLDECNGHFGCLDDGCEEVTYHYHARNFTFVPERNSTFFPYWTGCLGPSKGVCNSTVHQQYDNGADWCGVGCGYQICVQTATNKDTLNTYIASFGDANWLKQFTINPF